MLVGQGITFLLLPPEKVHRDDGMPVTDDCPKTEMKEFVNVVKREIQSVLAIRYEKR